VPCGKETAGGGVSALGGSGFGGVSGEAYQAGTNDGLGEKSLR